jgi:dehydrogenase/reductase SDR family protein 1
MVPRKQGLIVNISSFGGQTYLFNVAYGIGKAAVDRMAVDCGIELKKHNVSCLSLMLGAVRTELTTNLISGQSADKLQLKGDPNKKQVEKIILFNELSLKLALLIFP